MIAAAIMASGAVLLGSGYYGFTLFLVMPVFLGGLACWMFRPKTAAGAAGLGASAVTLVSLLTLLLGWEGLICIAMSLPLSAPMGAIGGWVVWRPEPTRQAAPSPMFLLLPVLTLPYDVAAVPPVYAVRTEIEIAAAPERVWRHVVSFSRLPEPREWYFRTGLAYPVRASIDGAGVGAIRRCEFTTGAFVEPIEVWDEPRLLRFRVTENPAPMHEWSPYGRLAAKHLQRYLVSERGQFELTRLDGGRTLLAGTTWYRHGLWPSEYWRWWSDAIIHRIHLRVLDHVRALAERSMK